MRYDRAAGGSLGDFIISADLYPDGDIRVFLRKRRDSALSCEPVSDILMSVLKQNVAEYVLASVPALKGDGAAERVCDLTDEGIFSIGSSVHGLMFHPVGISGWKDSQVTMGGVSLDEIDPATSESLLVKGLYITGELADRDFPCGGFNLSNAWITGLAAADDICVKNSGGVTRGRFCCHIFPQT